MFCNLSLHCLFALAATALAIPLIAARTEQTDLQWSSCSYVRTPQLLNTECANFTVPLDYTDPSSPPLTLQLIKIAALKGRSKGSVFLNFGGPGISGLGNIATFGLYMQAVTGGEYDLINVVPRGTADTIPFSCWNTTEGRLAAMTPLTILGTASEVANGQQWSAAELYATPCFEAQNVTGPFLSTSFIARDIVQVADALGESSINYWGISYGTLLGQTLAQMFPDRMSRVVIDGVVNAFEYYTNTEVQMFEDTDATFEGFCSYCAAAPDRCLLAEGNLTAQEISHKVYNLLEDIRQEPIPVLYPGGGVLLDYTLVKIRLVEFLYGPEFWPELDALLYNVQIKNTTFFLDLFLAPPPASPPLDPTSPDAVRGIRCGDNTVRPEKLSEIRHVFNARYALSKIGGEYFDINSMVCARWKIDAKERVLPTHNVINTSHPLLILNNRFDPVTSLSSARNASARFQGSVVLETRDQYGHASLSQGSTCQARLTQAYFVNGSLPNPGTVCEIDRPEFSTINGLDVVVFNLGFLDVNGNVTIPS